MAEPIALLNECLRLRMLRLDTGFGFQLVSSRSLWCYARIDCW
jgi:hypothetical protein